MLFSYKYLKTAMKSNTTEFQYENSFWSFKKNVISKLLMKEKISSFKKSQLFTFDDTSSFKLTSISNFVAIEISRFLSWKKTSNKEMINLFRKNQSLNKKNNISFRKKSFFCSNSSKNINSRKNVTNIVQEKRVRKSSKDFANTTWINEKMKKKFVFYKTLMIVFNTKTTKFEIKTTSSFKFHINNLSKFFFH